MLCLKKISPLFCLFYSLAFQSAFSYPENPSLPANIIELNSVLKTACQNIYAPHQFYSEKHDLFWKTLSENAAIKNLSIKPDQINFDYRYQNGKIASFSSHVVWKTGVNRVVTYLQLPEEINFNDLIIESIIRMQQLGTQITEVEMNFPSLVPPTSADVSAIRNHSLALDLANIGFDYVLINTPHPQLTLIHFRRSGFSFTPARGEGFFETYHQTTLPFLAINLEEVALDLKSTLASKKKSAILYLDRLTFGDEFYLSLKTKEDFEKARLLQNKSFSLLYEFILNHQNKEEPLVETALHALVNLGVRNSLIDYKSFHPDFDLDTHSDFRIQFQSSTSLLNERFFREKTKLYLTAIKNNAAFSKSIHYRADIYLNFISQAPSPLIQPIPALVDTHKPPQI